MRYSNEPLTNEALREVVPSAFAVQPYHKMSEKYTFVPTSVIIDGMRKAGFLPYHAVQARTRIEGKAEFTKHVIRFRTTRAELAVGDSFFETVLTNSMDGTSAYILDGGVMRLTCLNGARVSEATIESFRVRHIGNIIEEVINSAERLIAQAPKVIDTIQNWKQITMSRAEQVLFANAARAIRFDDLNTAPSADQLLEVRRSGDNHNDQWTVYNRVQEAATRAKITPRDADGNRIFTANGEVVNPYTPAARRVGRTREIKDLNFSAKVNQALWSLGVEFAKLKQS